MSDGLLHVRRGGSASAPPVVLLHGFMGSSEDWDEVVALWGDAFCCYALDLPGHGLSRVVEGDAFAYTFEGAAQSVMRTLDHLALASSSLIGYSMGGRLALRLALDHPDRWRCVVVEGGSPGLIQSADREARARVDEAWAQRFESETLEQVVDAWYNQPLFATLKRDPVRYREMIQRRIQNDPRALAASLRGMSVAHMKPMWDELALLRVEVAVAVGALDSKYKTIAARMQKEHPAIRVMEIPDAGHNAHEEQPVEFAKRIGTYVEECIWRT